MTQIVNRLVGGIFCDFFHFFDALPQLNSGLICPRSSEIILINLNRAFYCSFNFKIFAWIQIYNYLPRMRLKVLCLQTTDDFITVDK